MASDASPLFKRLYDMQLINESSFSYEFFEGEGHAAVMFGGESRDPQKVAEEINKEIKKLKEIGMGDVAKKLDALSETQIETMLRANPSILRKATEMMKGGK